MACLPNFQRFNFPKTVMKVVFIYTCLQIIKVPLIYLPSFSSIFQHFLRKKADFLPQNKKNVSSQKPYTERRIFISMHIQINKVALICFYFFPRISNFSIFSFQQTCRNVWLSELYTYITEINKTRSSGRSLYS